MTSGADDFRPHRFSTDDLLERDRVAIWREVFGRRMLQAEFEVFPGAAVRRARGGDRRHVAGAGFT